MASTLIPRGQYEFWQGRRLIDCNAASAARFLAAFRLAELERTLSSLRRSCSILAPSVAAVVFRLELDLFRTSARENS